MKILNFINENGILCSGIFGIITALISVVITIIIENKKDNRNTIRCLKEELEKTKTQLDTYTSIEIQEKCIDKSTGLIYIETLVSGKKRNICGYCWESKRIKSPLTMKSYYDDETCEQVIYGDCLLCRTTCCDK